MMLASLNLMPKRQGPIINKFFHETFDCFCAQGLARQSTPSFRRLRNSSCPRNFIENSLLLASAHLSQDQQGSGGSQQGEKALSLTHAFSRLTKAHRSQLRTVLKQALKDKRDSDKPDGAGGRDTTGKGGKDKKDKQEKIEKKQKKEKTVKAKKAKK